MKLPKMTASVIIGNRGFYQSYVEVGGRNAKAGIVPMIIANNVMVGYTTNRRLDNALLVGEHMPFLHYGPVCNPGASLCRGLGPKSRQYRCCTVGTHVCAHDAAGRPLCNPIPLVLPAPAAAAAAAA